MEEDNKSPVDVFASVRDLCHTLIDSLKSEDLLEAMQELVRVVSKSYGLQPVNQYEIVPNNTSYEVYEGPCLIKNFLKNNPDKNMCMIACPCPACSVHC